MINNKYDVELDGQGYIVKKGSYNKQLMQSFVNQVANDALTLSDFSIWKAEAQEDWEGGFNYDKRDFDNVFYSSSNIDIHYKQKQFRLSKEVSDNLDTGVAITGSGKAMASYENMFYIAAGDSVYESVDGSEGSYSLSKDCGETITDLCVFAGHLFAFMGTNGYYRYDGTTWTQESDGSGPGTGTNEAVNYAVTWAPTNTSYIYAAYDNLLLKGEWGGAAITWSTVKEFDEDIDNYLTKPAIFNENLFFWTKRGSVAAGPSTLWIHDGTNTLDIKSADYTVGTRMKVYDNAIHFFTIGRNFVIWYKYDGTNFEKTLSLENEYGGALYDSFTYTDPTGSPTGSGTYYDEGADILSDPVSWAEYDGKLYFTCQSNSASNYLYEYDGTSWVRLNILSLTPSANYVIGIFLKDLYILDDLGQIRKMLTTYTSTGYLISSINDGNLSNVDKIGKEIELIMKPLQTGCGIQIAYDLEESNDWISLDVPTLYGGDTNLRIPLSAGSSNVVYKKIRIKITLTTANNLYTPKILNTIIRYYPIPDNLKRWQLTLLSINNLKLYDGTYEILEGEELMNVLWKSLSDKSIKVFKDLDYVKTNLSANISDTSTVIPVVATPNKDFKKNGEIIIDDERIGYTGKTATEFTGCTRGLDGTNPSSHNSGAVVDNSYRVLFKDITEKSHLINQQDGLESLAEILLYKAL